MSNPSGMLFEFAATLFTGCKSVTRRRIIKQHNLGAALSPLLPPLH